MCHSLVGSVILFSSELSTGSSKFFIEVEMLESNLHIIEFRDELADHFKNLNIAWLQKYFYVEPIDEEMLSDPKKYIIDNISLPPGIRHGSIFLNTKEQLAKLL